MAESSAKVVIRGDAKALVNEAKKGEDAVNKIGGAADRAVGTFDKIGKSLAQAVAKAVALKLALSGIEEWRKRQEATAGANKTKGDGVVSRGLAAAKLGITSQQADAFTTAGGKSRDELTGFLTSLASGDNAKFLGPSGVARAMATYNSGQFAEGEVLDAAKAGRIDALMAETGTRAANMSPEMAEQLAARREENALASRTEDALAGSGLGRRMAAARIETFNAESPIRAGITGAIKGSLGELPIVGGGVNALIDGMATVVNQQTEELRTPPAVIGRTR